MPRGPADARKSLGVLPPRECRPDASCYARRPRLCNRKPCKRDGDSWANPMGEGAVAGVSDAACDSCIVFHTGIGDCSPVRPQRLRRGLVKDLKPASLHQRRTSHPVGIETTTSNPSDSAECSGECWLRGYQIERNVLGAWAPLAVPAATGPASRARGRNHGERPHAGRFVAARSDSASRTRPWGRQVLGLGVGASVTRSRGSKPLARFSSGYRRRCAGPWRIPRLGGYRLGVKFPPTTALASQWRRRGKCRGVSSIGRSRDWHRLEDRTPVSVASGRDCARPEDHDPLGEARILHGGTKRPVSKKARSRDRDLHGLDPTGRLGQRHAR